MSKSRGNNYILLSVFKQVSSRLVAESMSLLQPLFTSFLNVWLVLLNELSGYKLFYVVHGFMTFSKKKFARKFLLTSFTNFCMFYNTYLCSVTLLTTKPFSFV